MKQKKVVVFDMDETLGSFVQYGIFWDSLQNVFDNTLKDKHFFQILDKYPDFLRPNILSILKYLKRKKQKKHLYKIYIYTNNQGPKSWATKIAKYFHYKLNYKIFDRVIGAYKVNNKIVEPCRTTYSKTIHDLIKCTNLDYNTQICFIDDQYHHQMEHPIVNYIVIKPYNYDFTFTQMINIFIKSKVGKQLLASNNISKKKFTANMHNYIEEYIYDVTHPSKHELNLDSIESKKAMILLQNFFF